MRHDYSRLRNREKWANRGSTVNNSDSHSKPIREHLPPCFNSTSCHNARLSSLSIKVDFNLEIVPMGEHGALKSKLHQLKNTLNFSSSSFSKWNSSLGCKWRQQFSGNARGALLRGNWDLGNRNRKDFMILPPAENPQGSMFLVPGYPSYPHWGPAGCVPASICTDDSGVLREVSRWMWADLCRHVEYEF